MEALDDAEDKDGGEFLVRIGGLIPGGAYGGAEACECLPLLPDDTEEPILKP
jgi:hypothetical protein